MGLRIGVDIGIASVGWAVVNDEYEVLEAGVNIFSSADANKNAERRTNRGIKRLHRRRKTRVKDFEKLWFNHGKSIPENTRNNVLELRNRGLHEKLEDDELFFVLKNALLHRGISYLDDALDETSAGKSDYAKGISLNQAALSQNAYPCEIQMNRLKKYGKYRGNTSTFDAVGEKITLSNVFTTSSYKREIYDILKKQQHYNTAISDDFIEKFIMIFSRKREYYDGPGNEKSRTDYGKYTTQINPDTGKYITEENIFEKLIGKCSVYPDLTRAAGATYTAQEFNLLNDLNNITINGRKLTEEEKTTIIENVKLASSVNMRKIISNAIGEDILTLTGARIGKNGKEDFHHFEQYNIIRKKFEKQGWDINLLSAADLDKIGNILTLNTETDSIMASFQREGILLSDEQKETLISIRKKNSKYFNKWQSFSLKIMQELIPTLYEQPKNQMQLLTEMGVFKSNTEQFKDCTKIPCEIFIEKIYNPVVRRSIRITIRVINALIKKYGNPSQIIIEMPRDKNEEEHKKRISTSQRNNEKELKNIITKVYDEYGIRITEKDFYKQNKLVLKLKLWNEQNGICLYSGKSISIKDLLENPALFEIDHIIPRSVSYDDSRSNKVLVYHTENQDKGNRTPFMYLNSLSRDWAFEEFRSYVYDLNNRKLISKTKIDKLLFIEDITKIDVLKGFISRNINDTRYASRTVLNILQNYFGTKEIKTKIKVIRGSFTSQIRNAMKLEKKREDSYSHHAVDAMLMCYSQMGFEAYHKLQEEFIDFTNEKLIDSSMWSEKMDDETYKELMYQNKWRIIKENIQKAEREVKYWHKKDSKANRGLCNQTIRGTREIDKSIMKVNKLSLYNSKDVNTLKNMIKNGKENSFLMFRYDTKTWENMLKILEEYCDSKNPFTEYEKETGDYFRKYSKKHNGPRVEKLKYIDGEVGSCIDISHKYGYEKGSKKIILESLKPFRMDVYYHKEKKQYIFVGLKYSDLKFENGKYIISAESYKKALINEKLITDTQGITDLERMGYNFVLTFYKDEIIEYEREGKYYTERFLSRTMPKKRNYIETKPIDAPKFEKGPFVTDSGRKVVGLSKTNSVRKIRTDILGNRFYCNHENFSLEVDNV